MLQVLKRLSGPREPGKGSEAWSAEGGPRAARPGRGREEEAYPSPAASAAAMAIFSVYVVNKAGGLIYQLDSYAPRAEAEKTFSYPLDLLLKLHDERVLVAFGQRDGIRGGLGSVPGRGGVGVGRRGQVLPWWAAISGRGSG